MKFIISKQKVITGSVFFILFMFASEICVAQDILHDKKTEQLIDSLIKVKRMNQKTILVNFGADAITAINTQKGIVVIDAGISTGLTALYRDRIEKEFNSKNFIYVIDTHGHSDHVGGNSIFPEARIVGHAHCKDEIAEHCKNSWKIKKQLVIIVEEYDSLLFASEANSKEWKDMFTQKIRYTYALNDAGKNISVMVPDLTFSDSLEIDMGDITLSLFYFGKCHSQSDILIHCPELKILFTGDLFFRYGRLSKNDRYNDKERWLKAIEWLNVRNPFIETIVDGHGQILGIDDLEAFMKNISEINENISK